MLLSTGDGDGDDGDGGDGGWWMVLVVPLSMLLRLRASLLHRPAAGAAADCLPFYYPQPPTPNPQPPKHPLFSPPVYQSNFPESPPIGIQQAPLPTPSQPPFNPLRRTRPPPPPPPPLPATTTLSSRHPRTQSIL
ncbi:hypothetical protein M0802_011560 [Mischocyttarus mexicanus]|nr:hypothetical protein M0802_011560 [Mischocyttarus mexicanus]